MFKILLSIFLSISLESFHLNKAQANELIIEFNKNEIVAGEIYSTEIHADRESDILRESSFITPFLFLISIEDERINENNYDKKTYLAKVVFTNEFDGKNIFSDGKKSVKLIGIGSFQKTEVQGFNFYQLSSSRWWLLFVAMLLIMLVSWFLWRKWRKKNSPSQMSFQFKEDSSRSYFELMYVCRERLPAAIPNEIKSELLESLHHVVFKKEWSEIEHQKLIELNRRIISGK